MSYHQTEQIEQDKPSEASNWQALLFEGSKALSFATSHLSEICNFSKPATSEHSNWDSVSITRRFLDEMYASTVSRVAALTADAKHFAKEFGLQEPITSEIKYTVSRTKTHESGEGYQESIDVLLSNFVQILIQRNGKFSRATIERLTMNALFSQLRTQVAQAEQNGQIDSLANKGYLLTSPPDTTQAGYEGSTSLHSWKKKERHHSFIFLLQVENVTQSDFTVVVKQYRLWPNMQQLLDLHKELGQPIQPNPRTITKQLFANVIPVNPESLQQIASIEDFGPADATETPLQAMVRRILYKDSQTHHISFRSRPQVDEAKFWQYLGISPSSEAVRFDQPTLFSDFYLQRALPLFDRAAQLMKAKQERSVEFAETIAELDLVFTWYKTALGRWIITNNTNPLFDETAQWSAIDYISSVRNRILLAIQKIALGSESQPTDKLSVESLHEAFELHLRASNGDSLSRSELRILSASLGVLGVVNGGIQCGIGSVITVPVQFAMKSAFAEPLSIVSGGLSAFTSQEIFSFLSQVDKLDYVELDLRAQGATNVYMVPRSYLANPGCVVDSNTGRVLGPCDLYLDDPREKLAYAMTRQQFAELKQRLLDEAAQAELQSLPEFLEAQAHESLPAQILEALRILKQHLFKHVLSLIEWLAGDYLNEITAKYTWLLELKVKLKHTPNPFEFLQQEIANLLEHDPELLEELNNLSPQPTLMAV